MYKYIYYTDLDAVHVSVISVYRIRVSRYDDKRFSIL